MSNFGLSNLSFKVATNELVKKQNRSATPNHMPNDFLLIPNTLSAKFPLKL